MKKKRLSVKKKQNRCWIEYMVLNILVITGLIFILELWKTNILRYPINFVGDATQTLYGNMLLSDTWLFGYSERISYPYYAYMSDFPNCGILLNTIRCLEFGLIRNSASVINIIYIIGYLLAASTAYWALRKMEITKMVAGIVAILYSFLPFHFMRSTAHLTIGMYWPVPIFLYFLINYLKGGSGYERNGKGQFSRDSLLHIAILFVLGGHSVYYTYFACFFVCLTIAILIIRKEQKKIVKQAIADLLILLGNLSATVVVYVINIARYGRNESVVARSSADVETYGLKIGQLLMPVKGHRLSFLADWKAEYNELPLTTENEMSALGILFSIGFILLIIELAKKNHEDKDTYICSMLNIAAILLASIGGVASIIATVFSQIRCYNRICVFIAFFAAVSFAKIFSKCVDKIKNRKICYVVGVCVLAIGIFDQTTKNFVPDYEKIHAEWDNDEKFISDIEEMEGEDAQIYQMPYTYYPESAKINRMGCYAHTRGYIHSEKLVWSFGAYKEREGDMWNTYISSLDLEKQIKIICAYDFEGIYVDSFGYTEEEFPEIIAELKEYTQFSPIVSDNKRLYYFSLANYNFQGISDKEVELFKVFSTYDEGVYDTETDGISSWNWCKDNAVISIYNGNEKKIPVLVTMNITTLESEGDFRMNIGVNGGSMSVLSVKAQVDNCVTIPIMLKPGKNVLELNSDIPCLRHENDNRDLAFCIQNFVIDNFKYQEIDCREGATYTFGSDGDRDRLLVINGLSSFLEQGYTWTDGEAVDLCCDFSEAARMGCTINQVFQITDKQYVEVQVGGEKVFAEDVQRGEDITFFFESLSEDLTHIRILLPNAVSPKELNMSEDERELGIAIKSISFWVAE